MCCFYMSLSVICTQITDFLTKKRTFEKTLVFGEKSAKKRDFSEFFLQTGENQKAATRG